MKSKKIIKNILALLFLCALMGGLSFVLIPWSNEVGLNIHAQLLVNGKTVGNITATIYQRGSVYFADLPLTAVFEGLGYSVTWDETDIALIESDDETYSLAGHDLRNSKGETICEIDGIPASWLDESESHGELYVDSREVKKVFYKLGISPIEIAINPKDRTVSITCGTGDGSLSQAEK